MITVFGYTAVASVLCLVLLPTVGLGQLVEDLKPCFERYLGEKLFNIHPYHSEWRMKTVENCLEFCAVSSSRCKAIVYERHEHICHYFLDDGAESTVPSSNSVYLRVTAKECLDRASKLAGASLEYVPPTTTELPSSSTTAPLLILNHYNKTVSKPVPKREQILRILEETAADPDYVGELLNGNETDIVAPEQNVIKPSRDNNKKTKQEIRIPKINAETFSNYETDARRIVPHAKVPPREADEIELLEALLSNSDERHEKKLKQKSYGRTFVDKDEDSLDVYLAGVLKHYKPNSVLEIRRAPTRENEVKRIEGRKKELFQIYTAKPKVTPPKAQQIRVADKYDASKTYEQSEEERPMIRPPKIVLENDDEQKVNSEMQDNAAPAYIPKAKNFVASLNNGDKGNEEYVNEPKLNVSPLPPQLFPQISDDESLNVPVPKIKLISMKMSQQDEERHGRLSACQNDEKAVWLMVENAILDPKVLNKKTEADSMESCRSKCNLITNAGRNCPAFTYNDVDQQCILYTSDSTVVQNLLYRRSSLSDFSTRTATKFCYPANIEIFRNCSEIVAFHDFALNVVPREEFDGMPKGKEGLHACIELCVLSPHYFCKSATFLSSKGLCRLNEENSLSSPENFLEVTGQEQIYFENTCSQYEIERSDYENTEIERVTKSPVLKTVRIQPQHLEQPLQSDQYSFAQEVTE